jgi:serine/threonine-protein kinase
MGVVYKATQLSLQRAVALKVIRDDLAGQPGYRERFLGEARLAAAVSHPHVVSVFDVLETTTGQLVLVMQWVEGETLRRRLGREGALRAPRAVTLAQHIGSALDAVHASGMLHRDVKPANVLLANVSKQDHGYLSDFGIARAHDRPDAPTGGGASLGTAGYMAPEQIAGLGVSARSDLYAMACVVFEMLAGVQPFAFTDEAELNAAHLSAPRPHLSTINPVLDDRFDSVLMRALSVDPSTRYASGRELADALLAALSVRTTARTAGSTRG